jgi:hypothetical protein
MTYLIVISSIATTTEVGSCEVQIPATKQQSQITQTKQIQTSDDPDNMKYVYHTI